jgi:hypothetical protein
VKCTRKAADGTRSLSTEVSKPRAPNLMPVVLVSSSGLVALSGRVSPSLRPTLLPERWPEALPQWVLRDG